MNRKILITGATGALGSALVPLMLRNSEDQLILLVRAKGQDGLERRRRELMAFWGEDVAQSDVASRVRFVSGDITQQDLGLQSDVYRELTSSLTGIIHSAASVKLDLPLEESLKSSVGAVREVLTLQERAKGCKLDHVSTVGVNGRRAEPLLEERMVHSEGFFNTYEAGKAAAEQIVYQAQDRGMPITIHRPSMVVGDSHSGKIIHFQVFYFILRLLSGQLTRGFLPDLRSSHLDTIPCDLVARALCWSARSSESVGQIFHLSTGPDRATPLGDLQQMVRDLSAARGHPCPKIAHLPKKCFYLLSGLAHLPLLSSKWKTRVGLFPQFLEYASHRQRFMSEQTQLKLRPAGIEWLWPENYLRVVMEFYLAKILRPQKLAGDESRRS